MGYSPRQTLTDNIDAIRIAFTLKKEKRRATPDEIIKLKQYRGFGGIKAVLYNPYDDISNWSKADQSLASLIKDLHALIKENTTSEQEYKKYISSIKESTLSAFFTPGAVTDKLAELLFSTNTSYKYILEPASGVGQFIESIEKYNPAEKTEITAFEKDILTGLILKSIYPDHSIHACGFEEISHSKNGRFNLVVSNIPFGDFPVFDSSIYNSKNKKKAHSSRAIHSYFFTKAVDVASENGVIAFIVTSSFLDNQANVPTRKYLMENCDLISAIRFPNNLFTDIANTEVGSDLIIVQKNPNKKNLTQNEKDFQNHHLTKGINYNKLFSSPDRVIFTQGARSTNQYGNAAFVFKHEGGEKGIADRMGEIIKQDIGAIKQIEYQSERNDLFNKIEKGDYSDFGGLFAPPIQAVVPAIYENIDVLPHHKTGTLISEQNKVCRVLEIDKYTEKAKVEEIPLNPGDYKLLEAYLTLRDSYFKLSRQEENSQEAAPVLRNELNQNYDDFVKEFGYLNEKKVFSLTKLDQASYLEIKALEYFDSGKYRKADVFTRPTNITVLKDELTINEAFLSSLNLYGDVNLPFIENKTNRDRTIIIEELKGRIFYEPQNKKYIASEKAISGNVYEKLETLSKYLDSDPETEAIKEHIKALESAMPLPIRYDELDFNLGERWLPIHLFEEFACDLFKMNRVKVDFNKKSDSFSIEQEKCSSASATATLEYCVKGQSRVYNGIKLLEYALNDTTPEITKKIRDENGDEITIKDSNKIQEASNKIEDIQQKFELWMHDRPNAVKEQIEKRYNHLFNCYIKPKYDGTHLSFNDMDFKGMGIPDLYQSQKDAVWMQIMNTGGIVDHEVGLGKTLTMCAAAYESKRLGVCNKPMIIGMKANVADIAKQFQSAYPHSKMLYIEKFDKKNRIETLTKIKNNDWDCIIMSHDNMAKIPCDYEIQLEVLEREKREIEDALSVKKNGFSNSDKRALLQLEKDMKRIESDLQKVIERKKEIEDEGLPTFGEMGIDHIHVDESHIFKNLGFQTKHNRVPGLGNTEGSQRARFLQFNIATIQQKKNKELGATFYSGTTISNSLTELYLIFKYLVPARLEKQNIYSFDSWAAVFAKKSKEPEFSVTNELRMNERFRYFLKVPELASFYSLICDYKKATDIGLDRPSLKEVLVDIEPTEEQKKYIEILKDFARSGDMTLLGRGNSDNNNPATMLIATNESKKMALDMRLIDPDHTDDRNNKISQCCERIIKHYKESQQWKGTQLIFCDLGTPNSKAEFNVYKEIKRKLSDEYAIDPVEIQFIHDHDTDLKKKKLFASVNNGDVRILIGSTQKLGTGVNVQSRIVAIHHLDIPWKPSEMEQRNGRGMRTGNWVAKEKFGNQVISYIYAVKQTLDNYKFSLLKNKQLFIDQIKNGEKGSRRIDEGAADESTGMNFAEYVAVLSGNTDLLDKAKLDKKIAILEKDLYNFNQQKSNCVYRENATREEIAKTEILIKRLTEDKTGFDSVININETAIREEKSISINGFNYRPNIEKIKEGVDKEEYLNHQYFSKMGEHINISTVKNLNPGSPVVIGNVCGCEIILEKCVDFNTDKLFDASLEKIKCHIKGTSGINYTHNNGNFPSSDYAAGAYIMNAINKIPSMLTKYAADLNRNQNFIVEIMDIKEKTWGKHEELKNLKKEADTLAKKIEASITPKESKEEESKEFSGDSLDDHKSKISKMSQRF